MQIIIKGESGRSTAKERRDLHYEKHRKEAENRGAGFETPNSANDIEIKKDQSEMRRVIELQSKENEKRLGPEGLKRAWEMRKKGLI